MNKRRRRKREKGRGRRRGRKKKKPMVDIQKLSGSRVDGPDKWFK
jgi:hypothetical protein